MQSKLVLIYIVFHANKLFSDCLVDSEGRCKSTVLSSE